MTARLYYDDSELLRFDAVVREAGILDGRPFAVLDRTAFYPASGGQPFDTGALAGRRVLDVFVRDDDEAVVHVLDAPLEAGGTVEGVIDAARRRDHMQQHSGQHVLSAAFERTAGARTVSFHLGTGVSTIDLAATPDAAAVARAEDEANRIVRENRPVHVRYASAEEAAALPLRKEPVRGGTLRLVDVEGWDLSACGGTHVARTGAIGLIAVTAWERYKGGTRVSFVCGLRALAAFRASRDAIGAAVRQLSVLPADLGDAIARLQSDAKALRQQVRTLGERLARFEADELARSARDLSGLRLVCAAVEGADAQRLKTLAQAIAARPGHAAVLVGTDAPRAVAAARAAGAPLDAAALVKALTARFGGRGGGRPELAQGGGLAASPDEILSAVAAMIGTGQAG
jgi:alanyl-tRNA synthetase